MPRILVAPLDWGMGHTTRCICIVKALQLAGANVVIACNTAQQAFLQNEIDDVDYVFLEGYNILYAKNNLLTFIKIGAQIPKILGSIKKENLWLQAVIESYKIDAVISDNRFGLYTTKIPCVFVTHQLYIQSGIGKKIIEKINFKYINKFTNCWVPDAQNSEQNLSGILSHAQKINSKIQYINPLSRFSICETAIARKQILLILSGPEPQRSILLNAIAKQTQNLENINVVVAGNAVLKYENKNVQLLGNVNTHNLQKLICESQYIITRSGYTSIMDLAKLQKHALLIPTPGQTEQLYLAKYMQEKKWHITQVQNKLDIKSFIESKQHFNSYVNFGFDNHLQIISNWVQSLGK